MDAVCCYFGEAADIPEQTVDRFLAVAASFDTAARRQAMEAVAGQLVSSRLLGLTSDLTNGDSPWQLLGAELKQMIQMPGSRKRKRR